MSRLRPLRPVFDEKIRYGAPVPVIVAPPTPPTTLTVVGSVTSSTQLGGAWSVAVSGNYAYVATQFRGFTVVDISDPTSPTIVANIPRASFANTALWGVALYGTHAAVTAQGVHRLYTVDISTPTSPSIAGSVTDATNLNFVTGVAISGSHAVVTCPYNQRLTTVSLATPASPSVTGSVQDSTNLDTAWGVKMYGLHALVTNDKAIIGGGRFTTVDVTTPASPSVAGSVVATSLQNNWATAILDDTAVVTSWASSNITTIDILNPASPSVDGTYLESGEDFYGIAPYVHPTGNYAVTVSQVSDQAVLLDINTPASPTKVTSVTDVLLTNPLDIAGQGDHMFVVSSGADRLTSVLIS